MYLEGNHGDTTGKHGDDPVDHWLSVPLRHLIFSEKCRAKEKRSKFDDAEEGSRRGNSRSKTEACRNGYEDAKVRV